MAVFTATVVAPAPPLALDTVKIRARPEMARLRLRAAENRLSASAITSAIGIAFQIFAGAGAHGGHNEAGRLISPMAKIAMSSVLWRINFDRAEGVLLGLGVKIDQHHFGAHILNLAEHRVRRIGGEAGMTEHNLGALSGVQSIAEHRQPVLVFGQKRDGNALHGDSLPGKSMLRIRQRHAK